MSRFVGKVVTREYLIHRRAIALTGEGKDKLLLLLEGRDIEEVLLDYEGLSLSPFPSSLLSYLNELLAASLSSPPIGLCYIKSNSGSYLEGIVVSDEEEERVRLLMTKTLTASKEELLSLPV